MTRWNCLLIIHIITFYDFSTGWKHWLVYGCLGPDRHDHARLCWHSHHGWSPDLQVSWCFDNLFVRPTEMTFGLTKCGKLLYIIILNVIGPIRRLNLLFIAGYDHMQSLTLQAFPLLSEHQMSFQTFCH